MKRSGIKTRRFPGENTRNERGLRRERREIESEGKRGERVRKGVSRRVWDVTMTRRSAGTARIKQDTFPRGFQRSGGRGMEAEGHWERIKSHWGEVVEEGGWEKKRREEAKAK